MMSLLVVFLLALVAQVVFSILVIHVRITWENPVFSLLMYAAASAVVAFALWWGGQDYDSVMEILKGTGE